jgi:hypothetical protein
MRVAARGDNRPTQKKGKPSMSDLVIKYGERTLDFNVLPQASLVAMLRRGVSHYFGSEQASKVTAYFDPDHDDAKNRPDTAENRAAKKAEFQQAAYDALVAGTVGVSVRGPSVDPINSIINRLAKAEVKAILGAFKLKWPAKADDTVELPDGSKVTGAQLIARRLDKDGPAGTDKKTGVAHIDRLRKEAEKIAAEQAKKNAKALAMAEGAEL